MIRKNLISIVFTIFPLFFLMSILTENVAATSLLQENFDNNLNNWIIYSGTESLSLNLIDGILRTYGVGPRLANFLELRNSLPSKNLSIEVKFKFITNGSQGAGLGFNDTPIGGNINHQPLKEELIANIWPQAGHKVGSTVSICLDADVNCANQYTNVFEITQLEAQNWHLYRIDYVDGVYDFFLDNIHLAKSKYTTRKPNYIWVGNPENTTQNQTFSEFWFDYIRVDEIVQQTTPEWYFSQRDPLWKDYEYDHANIWNPGGVNTVERYGCAMTSAAMILDKTGIRETDLSKVDPGELNSWLANEKDGYLGNGLTNWVAIARHVKDLAATETATKLEFTRVEGTREKVDEILNSGKSAIVNLGGHFVVIYDSKDAENWSIADPYDLAHTSLPKITPLVSVGYYSPSQTDLSYFLFTSDPSVNLQLLDANGQNVPLIRTVESIKDDVTGIPGPELAIYTFPQPEKGKYKLSITNGDSGKIETYLYDLNGNVKIELLEVFDQEFEIDYDKDDVNKSTITVLDVIKPTLLITTPELTNKRIIIGTASDNAEINRVEVALQTKHWWKFPHNLWLRAYGTKTWKFFIPYLPDDQYRVRARARDSANNISEIVEKYITLDTTPPKVWGEISKMDGQKKIKLYASDKNGVGRIEYKQDKREDSWTTYDGPIASSSRLLYFRAFDKAGNVSSVKSMYVR